MHRIFYTKIRTWLKIKRLKLKGSAKLDYRKAHLRPIYERLLRWIRETPVLAKTKLGEAIQYARKELPSLVALFEEARLSLSNNLAERVVRPVTVGRKNWLFSSSIEGAKSSGVILSLLATAEANHLDPLKYLQHLLESLPNLSCLNR